MPADPEDVQQRFRTLQTLYRVNMLGAFLCLLICALAASKLGNYFLISSSVVILFIAWCLSFYVAFHYRKLPKKLKNDFIPGYRFSL